MGTWHGDPDDAADRFLAEHGMVSSFSGDDLVIEAGNEALLPPWTPMIDGGRESRVMADSHVPAPVVRCAVCATPVKLYGDAGWRHELGYRETGGCSTPWPEG